MDEFGRIELVFIAVLAVFIAAIAIADFRHHIIPNWANALLVAGGLAWQIARSHQVPVVAIVFAASVFALFWLIRFAFASLRGTTGLGMGDVKMAGASALWFDPWNLPLFLMIACVSALVYFAVRAVAAGSVDRLARMPFGPFLGLGLFVTFIMERGAMTTFIPLAAR